MKDLNIVNIMFRIVSVTVNLGINLNRNINNVLIISPDYTFFTNYRHNCTTQSNGNNTINDVLYGYIIILVRVNY